MKKLHCIRCGLEEQNEKLYVIRYDRSGHRNICIECNKVSARKSRSKHRQKVRDFLAKEKDVPCSDCGKKYPSYVMDFDHIGKKNFTIGSSTYDYSIKQLKEESSKCEVVCSNCHRERTHVRKSLLKKRSQ